MGSVTSDSAPARRTRAVADRRSVQLRHRLSHSARTRGYCEGVLTWLIREGRYGDVRLDGDLAVVLVIHFEGNALNRNRVGFLMRARCAGGRAGGIFKAWREWTSVEGMSA